LTHLAGSSCQYLTAIQQQCTLPALVALYIVQCATDDSTALDISNMPALQELCIYKCRSLTSIIGLDSAMALQEIRLHHCLGLTHLPYIAATGTLTALSIEGCTNLCSMCNKLTDFTALEELNVKQSGLGRLLTGSDIDKLLLNSTDTELVEQLNNLKRRRQFGYILQ
jgi:hypothetical protein